VSAQQRRLTPLINAIALGEGVEPALVHAVIAQESRYHPRAGWSYEEVRQALEKTLGFQGSLKTLYQYVWQLSREPGAAAPSSTALPAELAQLAAQPTMKAPGSAPAPLPSNASNLAPSTSRQEANHESLVRRLNAPL